MNEEQLRAMIREAVARHLGGVPYVPAPALPSAQALSPKPYALSPHPSHAQYHIINVGDACVIEPNVTCNHCGYCKCHGH